MIASTANIPQVIIADSETTMVESLSAGLQDFGWPLLAASTGEGIRELLANYSVAAILVDLQLLDATGPDFLERLHKENPEIGVVVCSDGADFAAARRCLRAGALDYLVKPFELSEVRDAVERALGHNRISLNASTMRMEAERRLGELVLLKEISETASTGEDLPVLFDKIIESVAASADVEVASLMLLQDDGRLHILAARGLSQEILETVTVAPGEGISGRVLSSGEPVLITDVQQDRRFDSFIGGGRYKNLSALSVPIRYKDITFGVININNKRSGGNFNLEDQNLLTAIAHQVALAIENFKLVTSLRHQTQQLEVANRSLVKLNQARSRLVCNLSHELKTPLTSITGYNDLTLNFFEKLERDEIKEYLGKVKEECHHLDRLISGMLRLFSIESGKESWRWRPTPVAGTIAEALMAKNTAICLKDLQTEIELPDDLHDAYGDPEKLGIVFNALIDNAVKFNRQGGRLSVIGQNRTVDGLDHVYVQVHNDGSSIPEESAEDIFDQYTQLGDINTAKPPGVGVGLAIVKAVLQRMKGQIFLENSPVEGSTFGLLLPTEQTFGALADEQ